MRTRQPRDRPRTVCDQCERDWADDPEKCVAVTIPDHPLHWQTVCIQCVDALGITGWAYRDGEPTEFVWGTAVPPRGRKGQKMAPEELLRSVSSAGYKLPPRPRQIERLDISKLVAHLWRDEAAAADEAA